MRALCDRKSLLYSCKPAFVIYSSQCVSPHESIWGHGNGNILELKVKA